MDVLLLAGYRSNLAKTALQESNGVIFFDQQLIALQNLGLNPIIVLSGSSADEILRKSAELRKCELVFDTNDDLSNMMTNLKAGALASAQTCFALPLEIPCPEKAVWTALKQAFQKTGFSTKRAVIQLTDEQGAPWHWGFPLFLTRLGHHLLVNEANLTSLFDLRLSFFHSVFPAPEDLAPQRNTL